MELEIVNLAAVEETFRTGEGDVLVELTVASNDMVDSLFVKLDEGKITTRSMHGQRRSTWGGSRKARADLRKVLVGLGKEGIDHVTDEVFESSGE